MTVPAAALILADHIAFRYYAGNTTTAPARCDCGWRGALCDHPAHLAEVLDRAGLLAARTPPETPTTRVHAERPAPTEYVVIAEHAETDPPHPRPRARLGDPIPVLDARGQQEDDMRRAAST